MTLNDLKVARIDEIRQEAREKTISQSRRRYSNTYSVFEAQATEPEDQLRQLQQSLRSIPGYVEYFQDPDTDRVFAFARYNTF